MTAIGRLELVCFDARDTAALADFYRDLTGWQIVRDDDGWIILRARDAQEVLFQPVGTHTPPQWPGQEHPQQFHLDLLIEDHHAAADRAEELGATRLAEAGKWITLADPAGHPFDLCQRDGVGPEMGLYAVTIDAPDSGALAHFYAAALGMEVTYEGPEGALVTGGGKTLMFQQIEGYQAPRWPDPAHPQQAHLDVVVDDLEVAEIRLRELGATRLPGGGDRFRTFADPAGHPFDITR